MDNQKPSRKKPAKTSLPSEKEALTAALNAKLPKPVQSAPLEPPPKFFAPPVEDPGTSAPLFDTSSNTAASFPAVYPNTTTTRVTMEVIKPRASTAPRWMTGSITPGRSTATSRPFVALRLRQATWTHFRCPTATHTHMAKAIVRPTKCPRERAKRRQHGAHPRPLRGPALVVLRSRLVDFLYFIEIVEIHSFAL
jgi:hypothetical protein